MWSKPRSGFFCYLRKVRKPVQFLCSLQILRGNIRIVSVTIFFLSFENDCYIKLNSSTVALIGI